MFFIPKREHYYKDERKFARLMDEEAQRRSLLRNLHVATDVELSRLMYSGYIAQAGSGLFLTAKGRAELEQNVNTSF